ncbi:receptor expression-enhancing protein 5 [Clonorchis sinensis]|uniref:Receptor expression-enhancing protein 5 n=1 Tax=Clonorchis sinensis TaxID=79923 RepID=G7Y3W2_CLOSI|nr:receptor expression-enhancing protein 5 [Clonorchis sinensis]
MSPPGSGRVNFEKPDDHTLFKQGATTLRGKEVKHHERRFIVHGFKVGKQVHSSSLDTLNEGYDFHCRKHLILRGVERPFRFLEQRASRLATKPAKLRTNSYANVLCCKNEISYTEYKITNLNDFRQTNRSDAYKTGTDLLSVKVVSAMRLSRDLYARGSGESRDLVDTDVLGKTWCLIAVESYSPEDRLERAFCFRGGVDFRSWSNISMVVAYKSCNATFWTSGFVVAQGFWTNVPVWFLWSSHAACPVKRQNVQMDRLRSLRTKLDDYLHKDNPLNDLLKKAEEKTKVDRVNLVLGAIVIFVVYLIFGYGTSFLASFVGFLYPAYRSIKALETEDKEDDKKWLTYWVVFAAVSVFEAFTDILFYWIPLYSLLKCCMFLFMMIPTEPNGSVLIYQRIIRPYFLKHEKKLDDAVKAASDLAGDFSQNGLHNLAVPTFVLPSGGVTTRYQKGATAEQ